MGTVIKATGVSTDPSVKGSVAHAVLAAQECLAASGVPAEKIDLLINVGVYRDHNMVEPSMAALIQKELGINLDYVKNPAHKPAFSFDLMNGACGLLNAVQVAGAFLANGAEYALIVSSDAHPSNERRADFPYAALGGAMLLAKDGGDTRGFGRLQTKDSEDGYLGVEGFLDIPGSGNDGRNAIVIKRAPDYRARLLDLTTRAVREYAAAEKLDLAKTLLVTPQVTPDFGAELAKNLGVAPDAAVPVTDVDGDPHSSALTLGYHRAIAAKKDAGYAQILFVAAGAGLTTACAVYRR